MRWIVMLAGGLLCLILGAAVGWVAGRFDWEKPVPVVREPQSPQESRLEYTPPEPPRMPVDVVAGNPMLRSLIRPTLHPVTEGVFAATGFALGNVGIIRGKTGLIVVDTTESPEAAGEIKKALGELGALPVRAIVYTHSHLDHVMGARGFQQEETALYANVRTPDFMQLQFTLLETFQRRARTFQAGQIDLDHAFPLPIDRKVVRGFGTADDLIPPTHLIEQRTALTLDGVSLELIPTAGETPDHLAVWLPDARVLFSGDLFYRSFPNLSTPMLEPRPVWSWVESIETFLTLKPLHLVPGHTDPVSGEAEVTQALTDYRDGIRFVHDETVARINAGVPVDQAVAEVALPAPLAQSPWLQEHYGRVSWSVRGLYQGYTGWYDGRGTSLNPLPPAYTAREVVNLAGGADKVLARAIELQQRQEWQQSAELTELVIAANPSDRLAYRIKAASMHQLAHQVNNLNNYGFMRSAYSVATAHAEASAQK